MKRQARDGVFAASRVEITGNEVMCGHANAASTCRARVPADDLYSRMSATAIAERRPTAKAIAIIRLGFGPAGVRGGSALVTRREPTTCKASPYCERREENMRSDAVCLTLPLAVPPPGPCPIIAVAVCNDQFPSA